MKKILFAVIFVIGLFASNSFCQSLPYDLELGMPEIKAAKLIIGVEGPPMKQEPNYYLWYNQTSHYGVELLSENDKVIEIQIFYTFNLNNLPKAVAAFYDICDKNKNEWKHRMTFDDTQLELASTETVKFIVARTFESKKMFSIMRSVEVLAINKYTIKVREVFYEKSRA